MKVMCNALLTCAFAKKKKRYIDHGFEGYLWRCEILSFVITLRRRNEGKLASVSLSCTVLDRRVLQTQKKNHKKDKLQPTRVQNKGVTTVRTACEHAARLVWCCVFLEGFVYLDHLWILNEGNNMLNKYFKLLQLIELCVCMCFLNQHQQ